MIRLRDQNICIVCLIIFTTTIRVYSILILIYATKIFYRDYRLYWFVLFYVIQAGIRQNAVQ